MKKRLVCLGLESSAHTIAASIVDSDFNFLADQRKAFTTKEGGMKPSEVAEHHLEHAVDLVKNALSEARLTMKDIDLIAFSQGPGLGPCLRVSAVVARTLSNLHNIDLVGVNHALAHIEFAKKICGAADPVIVYVSGGNSQILVLENGRYRVLGETLDTGIGNLFDSFGRALGLGFPAGPIIDKMYFEGKNYIELPYSVKGMDLQFTGLLTSAEKKIGSVDKTDLAYSLMHTAYAMLAEVTERALAFSGKKEVLVTGGVACSKALEKVLSEMCKGRKVKLFTCPCKYSVDNSIMISWTGIVQHKAKVKTKIEDSKVIQRFRVDSIDIKWS